jgi:hypothetical protein
MAQAVAFLLASEPHHPGAAGRRGGRKLGSCPATCRRR